MIWDLNTFRGNTAVITEDREYTYGELEKLSVEFAEKTGGRTLVFIFASNSIGSLIGYIGCLNNNIVPLMLDEDIDSEQRDLLIEKYQPSFIWTPEEKNIPENSECIFEMEGYVLYKRETGVKYDLYEELALLIPTSGSTGSPKLVRQSYKNILANTRSIVEYLHIDGSTRSITTLPMNYVYGLSIINTHLYAGASLVLTKRTLFQKEFWQLVKEKKVTSFGGVPYTYEMLDKLRFRRMELPDLKTVTQAGGKLPVHLHEVFAEWAEENGKEFVIMYGASEATARMSYLPPDKAVEKAGSIGIAIPGGRFEIVDDEGKKADSPEVPGELVYYGDNITLGYAEKGEDLALGDERNGVLHTGDRAKFDSDGYYYIVGRMKRFLKVFGNKVNLDEVDVFLKKHFDTPDIVAAGKDNDLVIFTENAGIKDDIIPYISHKLGLNRTAFEVRVIDKIPRNASGKILFKELEEL